MTFETAVEKILEILDGCKEAFMVAESVLLILLNRKLSVMNKGLHTVPASEPAPEPVPEELSKEQKKQLKTIKSSTRDRVLAAVDLYFSDKPDEDLTDDEKHLISAVANFVEV